MRWTQDKAAEYVFYEENDDGTEHEIRRYKGSFRKCLNRETTSPEYLEKVLTILSDRREAKALREIMPTYVPGPSLDDGVREKMKAISRDIDLAIKKK